MNASLEGCDGISRRHLFRAELGVLFILQGQADPSNETGLGIVSFNEIDQRHLWSG